jgi:hypothetical protein
MEGSSLFLPMKRLFTLFLSLLFLVVSVGFTASTHFCKDTKQETRLFSNHQNQVCPVCAAKNNQKVKKKKCCKYETEHLKLTEKAQKNQQQNNLFKFSGDAVPDRYSEAVFDSGPATAELQNFAFPFSTPIKSNPLYILHCVYRI